MRWRIQWVRKKAGTSVCLWEKHLGTDMVLELFCPQWSSCRRRGRPRAVCLAFSRWWTKHKLKATLLSKVGSSSKLSPQPKRGESIITRGELKRRCSCQEPWLLFQKIWIWLPITHMLAPSHHGVWCLLLTFTVISLWCTNVLLSKGHTHQIKINKSKTIAFKCPRGNTAAFWKSVMRVGIESDMTSKTRARKSLTSSEFEINSLLGCSLRTGNKTWW